MQHGGLGGAADPLALQAAQLAAVALQADAHLRERGQGWAARLRRRRSANPLTAKKADFLEIEAKQTPTPQEGILKTTSTHTIVKPAGCLPRWERCSGAAGSD